MTGEDIIGLVLPILVLTAMAFVCFRILRVLYTHCDTEGLSRGPTSNHSIIQVCKRRLERRWLERGIRPDGSILEYLKRTLLYEIQYMSLDSEIEVEIKFIEPLLRALGYSSSDLKVRVPVTTRLGHQRVSGVADWLVFEKMTGQALCIIEAKAQNVPLTEDAVDQARSYAYALSVPFYMVTNAIHLRIYKRSLPEDEFLLETSIDKLETAWATLESIIGVRSREQ